MTKQTLTSLLFVVLTMFVMGQGNVKSQIEQADTLMNNYISTVKFDNGFSSGEMSKFEQLFVNTSSRIVFDVPFRNTIEQNEEIRQISKDDREKLSTINIYGKQVSVELYLKILGIEAERFGINNIEYAIELTGKKDSSLLVNDTIIYEVSKRFSETTWSLETSTNYLVYIYFVNDQPKISGIRINDENVSQSDLSVILVDASSKGKKDKEYLLSDVTTLLHIEFSEKINDKTIRGVTDSSGQIVFERIANKSAVVYIDTAYNSYGIQYEIPFDWKNDGKKVNDQPLGGFTVGLTPYKWNGLAYSFFISAGAFIPDEIDKTHFKPNSNFNSQLGTKLGLSFNLTYFINHDRWKVNPNVWLFGLGSGVSIDYQMAKVTSDGFEQLPYKYSDDDGDDCEITFKGKGFSESNSLVSLTFPLFIETKRKLSNKAALSIRLGANFSLPVSSTYKASGTFTRWGYYPQNPLPITNDDSLNYFTDKDNSYSGDIVYNPILAEGFVKLNWFFNVFKKNPDNSLELGLMFAMPFSTSTNLTYTESRREEYDGYWMNIENDQYKSIAYATEKVYNYYFGISIGINLIKYRPR